MGLAPEALTLEDLRRIPGLEDLSNQSYTEESDHVHPDLTGLSHTFEPAMEQVGERVWNARGFDVANSTFVEGDEGVVVIDAMLNIEHAAAALTAFRAISDKPIKAIVYTHDHGDHVFGAPAFATQEDVDSGDVAVIAHKDLLAQVARQNGYVNTIATARAIYMYGVLLPEGPDGRVNIGLAPRLEIGMTTGLLAPNITFADHLDLEVAGVRMEMQWIPSEAPTEICVWLPDHGVLQSAECIQGDCFPNAYTIRGDLPRPAMQWVESLDHLRSYQAPAMAKSHGLSLVGTDAVEEHLVVYRDALQYVHDQTVRHMTEGLIPDQLVEEVTLPPHLREHRHVVEGYGSVPQTVRSVYSHYLGFFTGELTSLDPANYKRRIAGYVEAMGGPERIRELAAQAQAEGDHQWAIELLGWALRHQPDDAEARALSAVSHRATGIQQHNATWRNWYLTAAMEMDGDLPYSPEVVPAPDEGTILPGLPLEYQLRMMPVRLIAEETFTLELAVGVRVPQRGEEAGLRLRRGVLELSPLLPDDAAAVAVCTPRGSAGLGFGEPLGDLVSAGDVQIEGDRAAFDRLLSHLEPPRSPATVPVVLH